MCYKILNYKNTHLIAWNEILTRMANATRCQIQFARLLSQAHMLKVRRYDTFSLRGGN